MLYAHHQYVECIYVSGIAAECILRAYRTRQDPEFDSRHDLSQLLTASGLENFVPLKRRQEVAAALGEVWVRWKNDYRYVSATRLASAFRDAGLFHGIKGDQLKENARIALENSLDLVGIGDARWTMLSSDE